MSEFPRIPPNFDSALDTTRELRDFYMAQVREYEQLLEQARSQLFHAEALLSGLENLQPAPSASERSSEAIAPQQAPIGNGNGNGNGNGHNAANYAQQPLSTEQNFASGNTVDSISTVIASVLNSQREAESSVELLPPYEDLTLPNVIADLLQGNAGTILKLDFIVRSLYGKLPASQVVTVTERVKQALEAGVEEGRWQRDALNHPDNTDCYTWNLPLEVQLTPSAQTTSGELQTEEPYYFDDYISKTELLDLVDTGALTLEKMRKIAQDLHLFGYGSVKYPKSFAAFLAKNSVSRSVIQQYL